MYNRPQLNWERGLLSKIAVNKEMSKTKKALASLVSLPSRFSSYYADVNIASLPTTIR